MPMFTPELNTMRTISIGFVGLLRKIKNPSFTVYSLSFPDLSFLTSLVLWKSSLPYEISPSTSKPSQDLIKPEKLSTFNKITLSIIAEETGLVPAGIQPYGSDSSRPPSDFGHVIAPRIEATHNFKNAPALDILFVPGGLGVVTLEETNNTSVEDFIKIRFESLEYLVGVSFGAVSLARAGVLDGKRATTNKSAWKWITERGPNVTWVPQARWVEDGKIWTTSGMASGTSNRAS
jgi:hypothetical protein